MQHNPRVLFGVMFFISYSNASQLIYSLIGSPTMDRSVLEIRSLLLSESFLGIGSLVFVELRMVLGAHMVLWQSWIFWKKFFFPKMGKIAVKPKDLWMFMKSYLLSFFLIWSIIRHVAETFSGQVRFSKFRAGLLKHYMLNLISDFFIVPSCECVQIMISTM